MPYTLPYDHQQALSHLRRDEHLAPLINRISLPDLELELSVYHRLISAIIYQQLSGKAAATIYGRFIDLFPDDYPDPGHLLSLEHTTLRTAGLSNQKSTYVQNVAEYFLTHHLLDAPWETMPDEEIVRLLLPIKGVGEWTVHMILMFALGRPDVLPTGDLGVQQAMQRLLGLTGEKKELQRQMIAAAEPWRPYRSVASRYLWRWLDQ
ncbi:MAG: DNA-3-methyladenine glycosylase 2 family protein [Lewinella sp.]|nr:DNA-3-methyladenine glycosylase 2 family protein [Lewinella sp.]